MRPIERLNNTDLDRQAAIFKDIDLVKGEGNGDRGSLVDVHDLCILDRCLSV